MHVFKKTIEIDRPPEVVWPYLVEVDSIQMIANLESIVQIPEGPVEKGTRWEQTMRLLGKKLETTDEVIEVEQGQRLVIRSLDSPFPYTFAYDLESMSGGTRVSVDVEVGATGGFFGKFAEPVVTKVVEHEFDGQLQRLKAFAEA